MRVKCKRDGVLWFQCVEESSPKSQISTTENSLISAALKTMSLVIAVALALYCGSCLAFQCSLYRHG